MVGRTKPRRPRERRIIDNAAVRITEFRNDTTDMAKLNTDEDSIER